MRNSSGKNFAELEVLEDVQTPLRSLFSAPSVTKIIEIEHYANIRKEWQTLIMKD